MTRGQVRALVVVLALVAAAPGGVTAAGATAAADGSVLVVDDDGGAAYASIQAAVDAAGHGDTIEVRPGTYREQVTVGKNVTVVAPEGATLDGSTFGDQSRGFRIETGVIPTIEGFTVRNYAFGVHAARPPRMGTPESNWDDGWTVRNVTFRGCSEEAIRAGNAMTDWTVAGVRIEGAGGYVGITAFGSTGDWTIRNTVIRGVAFDGIHASSAAGEWTIRNVTVAGAETGVEAGFSDGDGTMTEVTIRNVETGVALDESSGDVTIADTVLENVTHPSDDSASDGIAVYAQNASGHWQIRNSVLRNYGRVGVAASGADPTGDATRNWWGEDGPGEDACIGNVRCGDGLSSRPAAGASLDDPGAPDHEPAREPSTGSPTTPDGRDAAERGTPSTGESGTPQAAADGTATTVSTPDAGPLPAGAVPGESVPMGLVAGSIVLLGTVVGAVLGRRIVLGRG